MPTKNEILRAKVRSLKTTLKSATPDQKKGFIGIEMAKNFNKILEEVSIEHPSLGDALPAQLTWKGPFAQMGQSDTSYLDLEIYADQLLALLDLAEH